MPGRPERILRGVARQPQVRFLALLMVYWGLYGRRFLATEPTQVLTELPILISLHYLLRAPLRTGWVSDVVASIPVIALYALHDYLFAVFASVPDLGDAALVSDLVLVFGAGPALAAGVVLVAVPLGLWLWRLEPAWFRPGAGPGPGPGHGSWRRRAWVGLVVLWAAILGGLYGVPSVVVSAMETVARHRNGWSPHHDVERYGRLYMLLLRQGEIDAQRAQLGTFRPPGEVGLTLPDELRNSLSPRNVYVIQLESFIDPTLFRNVRYSVDPVAAEFRSLVDDHVGVSLSPGFGGYTALSEFEVLCGVPALGLVSGVEFVHFRGSPTPCLPEVLAGWGYATVSTHAVTALFYNLPRAMRSVGFRRSLFSGNAPDPADALHAVGSAGPLPDDSLFAQVDDVVAAAAAGERPVFSYVMTMYGHTPFDMDVVKQPPLVEVDPPSEVLRRIANLTLYRTRALADHLQRLRAVDPGALVVVMGDHLPPLPGGVEDYRRLGYGTDLNGSGPEALHETMLLVMDGGRFERVGPVCHFQIPGLIVEHLTGRSVTGPWSGWRNGCTRGGIDRAEYLEPYKTILGYASHPGYHGDPDSR